MTDNYHLKLTFSWNVNVFVLFGIYHLYVKSWWKVQLYIEDIV